MTERRDPEADCQGLERDLTFALWRHRRLLPAKRPLRDSQEGFRLLAARLEAHLKLCGWRLAKAGGRKNHSAG